VVPTALPGPQPVQAPELALRPRPLTHQAERDRLVTALDRP
jgi:hypothetical protein